MAVGKKLLLPSCCTTPSGADSSFPTDRLAGNAKNQIGVSLPMFVYYSKATDDKFGRGVQGVLDGFGPS
jgi:hypothetical protein